MTRIDSAVKVIYPDGTAIVVGGYEEAMEVWTSAPIGARMVAVRTTHIGNRTIAERVGRTLAKV